MKSLILNLMAGLNTKKGIHICLLLINICSHTMSTVGQLTNLDEMRIVLCGCTLLLKCNDHLIYINKLKMNHQFPVYVVFYFPSLAINLFMMCTWLERNK